MPLPKMSRRKLLLVDCKQREIPMAPHTGVGLRVVELTLDRVAVALDGAHNDVVGVHGASSGGGLEPMIVIAGDIKIYVGKCAMHALDARQYGDNVGDPREPQRVNAEELYVLDDFAQGTRNLVGVVCRPPRPCGQRRFWAPMSHPLPFWMRLFLCQHVYRAIQI